MVLPPTTKILPNWALAGVLGGFVAGTYWYSIRAVGDDSAQVVRVDSEPCSITDKQDQAQMPVTQCSWPHLSLRFAIVVGSTGRLVPFSTARLQLDYHRNWRRSLRGRARKLPRRSLNRWKFQRSNRAVQMAPATSKLQVSGSRSIQKLGRKPTDFELKVYQVSFQNCNLV